jgi:hypothetical protein
MPARVGKKKARPVKSHKSFRSVCWTSNFLLVASLVATIYSGVWEISVRRYLRGFSDAIIPASTQQKAEAILAWMLGGPPRFESARPALLSARDPEDTLNHRELLEVCGSATNAFPNPSRSAGVPARRLLLLAPDRTTRHVVAKLNLGARWVGADATYRTFLKDETGNLLTKQDLQDPQILREATGSLPNYSAEYTYQRTALVRLAALPFRVGGLRTLLDRVAFAAFFFSVAALVFFLVVRLVLGWIADNRLRVPRFHLRANLSRATAAFFTSPEIK